uniref:Large ribosomal subunit protein uL4 C-terminal domain-containing protein n=1 Tax=Chromera velia CCMP2878 TaxID=1169474 RepID=A0A0G4ICG4_9ALVE|eukprot:Cvel_13026.t1-p1 / transcript=Cvel_13026.t1 / gene=Cvel_13026 / organism=Chromera_velia_CCMP2878 / gene_product=60S ribosomal protein L4, putative / transcript_product=60S ribosomal protein L4, putative / location=Cvel_scaffold874:49118-53780(+) / protein_length=389 / sequence_SO=supercontig / SO=protein_coding / is_pseudo=false
MAARPTVTVHSWENPGEKVSSVQLPSVFSAPIRPDLVTFVHKEMAKNKRQAHGVKYEAGYGTSAESWGTGRAVARIPRVPGGGTHRAGQGAFGNMCRGGGMFAPLMAWRRIHRKINVTQKRHAVASALAACAVPALVMARGHRVEEVPELPLVVSDGAEGITKTKEAVAMLTRVGCSPDLEKSRESKQIRAGKGKGRNRRYTMRKGPLVVYSEDNGVTKSLKNIPGVDTCCVDRLNLLQLAPGGSLGRLVVFTESAFKKLQGLFGSYDSKSEVKSGYTLLRPLMTNADLNRIINSDEIQSVVRPMKEGSDKKKVKKNPLKNKSAMKRLNPAKPTLAHIAKKRQTPGTPHYEAVQKAKKTLKADRKTHRAASKAAYRTMISAFSEFEATQ